MSVAIGVSDAGGPLLNTAMSGKRLALTDRALWRMFFTHPLLTLKVVLAIHWEAFFLWIKRVGFRKRPSPPKEAITIIRADRISP